MGTEFEQGTTPREGEPKMNDNQSKQENLLDTTECLEAVGVFRGWKNLFFIIVLICMLFLQAIFWVIDLNLIGYGRQTDKNAKAAKAPLLAAVDEQNPAAETNDIKVKMPEQTKEIQKAVEKVVTEETSSRPAANQTEPAPKVTKEEKPLQEKGEKKKGEAKLIPDIKSSCINWLILLANFVLILSAALYCLSFLFSLLLSLVGRLGGVNHITRAFFLSLILLILLLPWQNLFSSAVKGIIYTPEELTCWMKWYKCGSCSLSSAVLYYLRFSGYWLLGFVLLILSMVRSSNWTKATLRRMEVM